MADRSEEQQAVLDELMPKILLALSVAHDVERGYGYRGPGVGQRYDITPAEGLARLNALELGALLDRLNDWCWCPVQHEGACPFPVPNDDAARNWHIRRDERNGRHTP